MKSKERLKLLLAYDGRPFRGWQSQATRDAVQDFVEAAFLKLVSERVVVIGSGRTDAGVHAVGQVAHADVPRGQFDPGRWQAALNAHLPPEIRVLRVTRARPDFHAQFRASGKIYTYRIWNSSFLHPLEIGRAWFVPGRLDLETLRAGAKLLCGTHDFARFAVLRRGQPERDTVRTIRSIALRQRGPLLTLRFEGNGFLYKMVRMLTGSLVRCAQHRAALTWLEDLLEGSATTHFAAPAAGLYLTRVLYAAKTDRVV
ncbi:MAG: tRNA pseudouridine38-40 synthase [Chthoniobacter sp.]|jgi:tRNA pseudouridine38-40 synthase|nr:tRNA pseudouridine38-40 synthase [Chthoniobacter sp.]